MKIEFYLDKKKKWRFRIKARNNKILCHSEGYERKKSAVHAVSLILSTSILDWKIIGV